MYKTISIKDYDGYLPHWTNFVKSIGDELGRLLSMADVDIALKRFDARFSDELQLVFETEQGYLLYLLMYS